MTAQVRPHVAQPLSPPMAMEAETTVLGGLLLDNRMFDDVRGLISADDFYRADHQAIFGSIDDMIGEKLPCDYQTLTEHLRNCGTLQECGGAAYLNSLAIDVYSTANVRHCAEIVRDRSVLRKLIGAGADLSQMGYRPEGRSPAEILAVAEKTLTSIRHSVVQAGTAYAGMPEVMEAVERRAEELRKNPDLLAGLRTGFIDLDRKTAGLQDGDLVIIAGRPSMGKTSVAMNIAEHVAAVERKPVGVFSMEMSTSQLGQRLIASYGRIPLEHLRSGRLDEQQWARLVHTSAAVRNLPIYIDAASALSPYELRSRARRMTTRHDLKLIIVDYLQLMQVPGREDNRANEVAEISRHLKGLAKELGIPVIALSQLSRKVEDRTNRRPRMSDLRESGGIEQDADVVIFIYRDEVYNPQSQDKGVAEFLIEKQRNGPIGMVKAAWVASFCRFDNIAPEYYRDESGFD